MVPDVFMTVGVLTSVSGRLKQKTKKTSKPRMLKQKNWWIETAQKLSKQTLPIYICNMDLTWAPNLWRGKSHSFLLVGSAKPIRFPANQWNPICLILPNPWSCRKTWFPNGFSWFLLTSLWVFYHGNVPPGEGEISEARTYFGQSKIDLQVEGYLHLGGQDRLPMDSKWVGAKGICLVPRVGGQSKSKQSLYI